MTRVVGEREERLREAARQVVEAWQDRNEDVGAIGQSIRELHEALASSPSPPWTEADLTTEEDIKRDTYTAEHARELRAQAERLGMSPSPPDRDLSSEGDERFRVFALMMYDHGCAAPETCTQDVPCGPCAAADALGEPRWVQK